jgi:surfeit locus 1 family protein
VTLRLGNRQFKPALLGTALALAGVALGVRLGMWQIDRALQKTALIAQFEKGAATTVDLDAANGAALPRYQRVHFSGHYDARHQVLLDNMPSQQGQAGFRVLTPMELAGGGWLLVDRGWVPMGATRSELPATDVAETSREIFGRLDDLPEPGVRLSGQAADGLPTTWPQVMNFPRHDDLERVLGRPLQARIVRLDAAQPDGYERAWTPSFGFGPQRHLGYAVQWFALAVAVVVIYLVLSFKRVGAHDDVR